MDNEVSWQHYTMLDWEQRLAPQVHQVELLGEITLSEEQTRQLGQLWGQFIDHHRGWGVHRVSEHIKEKYPCALAAFLVARGVHDSNAENGFWADFNQTLGHDFDSNWHQHFGLLFEEILEDNHLPLFRNMGGYRYVSLILLHGGIPNYSLPDYFTHLLRPAVTRPLYAALSPAELIDEWLHHSSGHFLVDKPVLRFLEYGGQVAVDFVERTRDLAHEFLETGITPLAEEVGLPQRIIEAFHHWAIEGNGFSSHDISRRERTSLRLRRPEIQFDPWGEGLTLQLLPQQIPAIHSSAKIEWEIKIEGRPETTLPARLERVGYNLQTTPEALMLERHIASCEVALWLDGEVQHAWSFNLERPLLVFDPQGETLLTWKVSLPARYLYLLYPQEAVLTIEGPARKVEEFNALPWGWAGFKAEAWDLSQATQLTLRRGDEAPLAVPIRADEAAQRPHLVGGTLHQTFNLIGTPLYLGAPPVVRLPLVGRTSPDEELTRWRFTLYNPWEAAPTRNMRRESLDKLRPHLILGDGYVDLPLNNPVFLGDAPLGSYIIRLRGPLGRDAELPLRLLPHLYLTGHERLYLPDPHSGPSEIELLLETPAGLTLEAQAGDNPCQVRLLERQAACWTYQVVVSPEVIEARLVVISAQPDGQPIRVPLHVPLRRLRWTLTGDTAEVDSQRPSYTGQTLKRSVDALEQITAPVLLVDLGHTDAIQPDMRETLTLHLVDLEGRELQQRNFTKCQRDPGRSVWRFDLSPFLDTIRPNLSPIVRFELEYITAEGPVRLPVLSLTRSIHVENVQVRLQTTGLTTSVKVTWHEPARLRHRRVRFWPVWQPWRPCREELIPDEAAGELSFAVSGPDFLVDKYLLEFLVVDPWTSPPTPLKPPAPGPNTAALELIRPDERLQQLEQAIQRGGPTFVLFLEHACIAADRGQPEQASADLEQCYEWCDQATLPQFLALMDLVETLDDQRLLTALRLKMSKPERLRQVLADYKTGQMSMTHFEAYRNQLVRRTGLWPAETCVALLDFPYEPVQIYALMQLIRRGAPAGGETILQRVKEHRFADIDGVDLFEINMDFAADFLGDRLNDPDAARLLTRVTERDPDRNWPVLLVRSGCFVRCTAGWGRIDQIETATTNQQVDYFLTGQIGFRLRLTLRPGHDQTSVTLEVLADRQRLLFRPELRMIGCTKSPDCAFITTDANLLYNGHNRVAHGGINAQYQFKTSPLVSIKPLEYRLRAPHDMLI